MHPGSPRTLRRFPVSKTRSPPRIRRRPSHSFEDHSRSREFLRRGARNRFARLAPARQYAALLPPVHHHPGAASPHRASPTATQPPTPARSTNLLNSFLSTPPIARESSPGSSARSGPPALTPSWFSTAPSTSGKTVLARALRALIDPSPALIRRLPDRDDDLLPLAFENWILAFDDTYAFSAKISEALCAISSGDALRISQPDSRDALEFEIARPIILAAPHDETKPAWTPARSLSNRTVTIQRAPSNAFIRKPRFGPNLKACARPCSPLSRKPPSPRSIASATSIFPASRASLMPPSGRQPRRPPSA